MILETWNTIIPNKHLILNNESKEDDELVGFIKTDSDPESEEPDDGFYLSETDFSDDDEWIDYKKRKEKAREERERKEDIEQQAEIYRKLYC